MMLAIVRKVAFAFPFACLTALLSHEVRFGDEHAFGGEANEAIVSAAVGGSITVALLLAHAFLAAGSNRTTGSVARSRALPVLPGWPLLFGLAAGLYYTIETLEGNGIELGWATVLLAVIAGLLAGGLRWLCDGLAGLVDALVREYVARLSARPVLVAAAPPRHRPLRAQTLRITRRLGRAPPYEQRSPEPRFPALFA